MEPLSGVHQMWSLVETSNADHNGHETLVKVGRNAPWTSAGLVLSGLTVDTSLSCPVFVDVHDSQAQVHSFLNHCTG